MKNVAPETAKAALIARVNQQTGHLAYLVRLGSWTLISEFAEQVARDALALRALESLVEEPNPEQVEFAGFTQAARQTQFSIFSPAVGHSSARRDLPAPPAKAAGSVVFGGRV